MPKRTMIVLVEVEADTEEQMPDKHDLATALDGALRNEPGDPFRWGDPTVYDELGDLVADCDEGHVGLPKGALVAFAAAFALNAILGLARMFQQTN